MDSLNNTYRVEFIPGWDVHFNEFDVSIREQILKKIVKQQFETGARHLKHGLDFYILEAGQYRIAMRIKESEKIKEIHFAGNHKQYEKWYQNVGFGDEDGKMGFYKKYVKFISLFSKTKPVPVQ